MHLDLGLDAQFAELGHDHMHYIMLLEAVVVPLTPSDVKTPGSCFSRQVLHVLPSLYTCTPSLKCTTVGRAWHMRVPQ